MKKIITLALVFIFGFISTAFSEITFKAEVDKTIITTDELLTYKVTVKSSEKKMPQPEIPEFNGFKVISQSHSSAISFGRGSMQTTIVYIFVLSALDMGRFKIDPAFLKLKDKVYTSESFEVEVSPGKTKPKPPIKSEPDLDEQSPAAEPEYPQITL